MELVQTTAYCEWQFKTTRILYLAPGTNMVQMANYTFFMHIVSLRKRKNCFWISYTINFCCTYFSLKPPTWKQCLVSMHILENELLYYVWVILSGHTRYSTAGLSEALNCQPFVVETLHGLMATAHNGELVNANPLKQKVRHPDLTPLHLALSCVHSGVWEITVMLWNTISHYGRMVSIKIFGS